MPRHASPRLAPPRHSSAQHSPDIITPPLTRPTPHTSHLTPHHRTIATPQHRNTHLTKYRTTAPPQVDTAPLTGEPLPWSVPRPDKAGEPGSGKVMWAGMTVVQGEAFCQVTHTGLDTEIGKAAALVMQVPFDPYLIPI